MNTAILSHRSARTSTLGALAIVAGLTTSLVAGSAGPVQSRETKSVTPASTSQSQVARSYAPTRAELYVAKHPSIYVRSMTAKVNAERKRRGMRPYSYSPQLSAVALRWARTMRSTQSLKHNPRLTSQVRGYRWVGENVGYGPSITRTHGAFMASKGHRANVLDRDFTQIGMSVVKDSRGRYWVVEVFRKP